MSTPFEWRLNDIEHKADRACRSLHEVDALRGDVARLERALGAVRAEGDGLRALVDALSNEMSRVARGEQP